MFHCEAKNNLCLFKKCAEYQIKVNQINKLQSSLIFNAVLGHVKAFSFSHLICH